MGLWNIDPDHTVAAFAVRHMMIALVRGQFNRIRGTIRFDPPDLNTVAVDISIDASVMTTGIEKRNQHLKSPDFLDVEKYPEITFKSTGVVLTSVNGCKIEGDLTLHGVTRPVTLDAQWLGPVKSPFGGETTIGVTATTRINREDFGIAWNVPMESGGVMVGKELDIEIYAEGDLVEEKGEQGGT